MSAPSPTSPPAAPRRTRARRVAVAAAVALALAALSAAAGWGLLQTRAARAALRARVDRALAARLPGALVGGTARVDGRFRVVVGPVALPSRRPGAPLVVVREVAIRPRWRALLAGRVEAASVSLADARVDATALDELAQVLERARGRGASGGDPDGAGGAPPAIAFDGLRVRAALRPGLTVELGPLSGRVVPAAGGGPVDLRVRFPGGGRLEGRVLRAAADAPDAQPRPRATLRVDGLTAAALPDALRRRLPLDVTDGALSGELVVDEADRGGARATFRARVDRLTVAGARLATAPVGPVSVSAAGEARLDLAARALSLERVKVALGGDPRAAAEVSLAVALLPEPRFALRADAPALDWDALVEALPAALSPGDHAPPVAGTFAARLAVDGPLRRPAAWRVDGGLDLSGLRRGGRRWSLDGSFAHRAQLDGGRAREVRVGPENPRFVAVAALPPHVVRAVTVSEDAGFWGHRGIDFHELAAALADGARRGRLRGASTITQQVAKNVFLSPERTWARKAREALLTVALEAALKKPRILEIYLNVAEWGPGIVGLGEAARHYFGKDARDLTAREAAFLATIIPNPVRYHMYCARGALTPAWDARVDGLLLRLRELEVLTDDELSVALAERLAFAHG